MPDSNRLDGRTLLVLASHPLRTRLLSRLRLEGPATATTLARTLGTNSGATSYHLRKLAEVGLVAEADDVTGAGRERWWRAAQEMHSWFPSDLAAQDDGEEALAQLHAAHWRQFSELADNWLTHEHEWSPAWRDAAGAGDYFFDMSPEQVRALQAEITEVVDRHRAAAPGPDARRVHLYVHYLPTPESPEGGEPR